MMRLASVFLALFWFAAPAAAQVTFDAKTAAVVDVSSGTTMTLNLTVGSGTNRALILAIMWAGATIPTVSSVVWNTSQTMTAITGTNTGTNGGCSCAGTMYGLVAPASGAHSIVITWTGAAEAHATAVSFTGVDQTGGATSFPHGTFAVQNTNVASPATATVTSATGNIVVSYATEQSSAWGTISGTTIATNAVGPQLTYASNYTSGAATVSPTLAFGANSTWSFVATDILASGGGPPPSCSPTRALMGVGC